MREIWPYPPTASGSYGAERLGGRKPADEIWVDFKMLKLFYRLNYLDFYFVEYLYNFTAVLEMHLVGFCQVKVYCKVCFEVQKI